MKTSVKLSSVESLKYIRQATLKKDGAVGMIWEHRWQQGDYQGKEELIFEDQEAAMRWYKKGNAIPDKKEEPVKTKERFATDLVLDGHEGKQFVVIEDGKIICSISPSISVNEDDIKNADEIISIPAMKQALVVANEYLHKGFMSDEDAKKFQAGLDVIGLKLDNK